MCANMLYAMAGFRIWLKREILRRISEFYSLVKCLGREKIQKTEYLDAIKKPGEFTCFCVTTTLGSKFFGNSL
jgi:hypothetical protein